MTQSPDIETVKFWADGWRLGVVVKRGRKWLQVLDCGTLRLVQLPTGDLIRPEPIPPKRLKRLLDRKRRTFNRSNLGYAKAVTILLKEMKS